MFCGSGISGNRSWSILLFRLNQKRCRRFYPDQSLLATSVWTEDQYNLHSLWSGKMNIHFLVHSLHSKVGTLVTFSYIQLQILSLYIQQFIACSLVYIQLLVHSGYIRHFVHSGYIRHQVTFRLHQPSSYIQVTFAIKLHSGYIRHLEHSGYIRHKVTFRLHLPSSYIQVTFTIRLH